MVERDTIQYDTSVIKELIQYAPRLTRFHLYSRQSQHWQSAKWRLAELTILRQSSRPFPWRT